jgi:hypothetical protein
MLSEGGIECEENNMECFSHAISCVSFNLWSGSKSLCGWNKHGEDVYTHYRSHTVSSVDCRFLFCQQKKA